MCVGRGRRWKHKICNHGPMKQCSVYLVPLHCKHEWCSIVFITLVHPKHHDQVLDHAWMLPRGDCHVQGVRVFFSAVGREKER